MKFVIDTSSLLAFVRYYLPFDKARKLKAELQARIEDKEIIVIDKVWDESKYTAKKAIYLALEVLHEKKNTQNTDLVLPDPKFFKMLDNNFTVQSQKKQLEPEQYEALKAKFLSGADCKMILLCYVRMKGKDSEDYVIITEETDSQNDGKLFKKIPLICKELRIECISIADFIKRYSSMRFRIEEE
jgi:hypothetical protein